MRTIRYEWSKSFLVIGSVAAFVAAQTGPALAGPCSRQEALEHGAYQQLRMMEDNYSQAENQERRARNEMARLKCHTKKMAGSGDCRRAIDKVELFRDERKQSKAVLPRWEAQWKKAENATRKCQEREERVVRKHTDPAEAAVLGIIGGIIGGVVIGQRDGGGHRTAPDH